MTDAGIPEPGTGQISIGEPRPGVKVRKPVVLWGREGSNPSPGAKLSCQRGDLGRDLSGNTVPMPSDPREAREPFSTCLASSKTIQQRLVAPAY